MLHPVYLVRHGESEWNQARITQGQTAHPPLTTRGRHEAMAAAATLRTEIERAGRSRVEIVTSDLVRATQTAEILAAEFGVGWREDARLRERHMGQREGRRHDVTKQLLAAARGVDHSLPGGESLREVARRFGALLTDLDRSIINIVVTHGEVLRVLGVRSDHEGVEPVLGEVVPNGAVLHLTGEWDEAAVSAGARWRGTVAIVDSTARHPPSTNVRPELGSAGYSRGSQRATSCRRGDFQGWPR